MGQASGAGERDEGDAVAPGQQSPPRSRTDVAAAAGIDPDLANRYWHAMGFPVVGDDDEIFTDEDAAALSLAQSMVADDVITQELALATLRAFARSADRLAVWQTQLVAEAFAELPGEDEGKDTRSVPDPTVARDAMKYLGDLAAEFEPILIYTWRRHLDTAMARMLVDAESSAGQNNGMVRIVGFADLVAFTSLVRRMSEAQLGRLVQHFEVLASDVITRYGGRVIKTVGDEVLFVHSDAAAAASISLDLVDAMAQDDILPPVRVGMAIGPVVPRLGDVFGVTVNRASRITAVTPSGAVHVDEGLADYLSEMPALAVTERRRRTLRGIGPVTLFDVARSTPSA